MVWRDDKYSKGFNNLREDLLKELVESDEKI